MLQQLDSFAFASAVYINSSVSQAGGAVAVLPHDKAMRTVYILAPCSSTL